MIRIQGEQNQSHDPKLKVPAVASPAARAAVAAVLHAQPSALDLALERIAALEARVLALEALPRTAPVTEPVTEALTSVTPESNGNAGGNAVKLTAAEKQRAYRERQKAKRSDG